MNYDIMLYIYIYDIHKDRRGSTLNIGIIPLRRCCEASPDPEIVCCQYLFVSEIRNIGPVPICSTQIHVKSIFFEGTSIIYSRHFMYGLLAYIWVV